MPRSEQTILSDLRAVECGLSPENIWCDGEASPAQAHATERRLRTRKAALIRELGRQPTDKEIYGI